jgi:hypothetical protein
VVVVGEEEEDKATMIASSVEEFNNFSKNIAFLKVFLCVYYQNSINLLLILDCYGSNWRVLPMIHDIYKSPINS